MEVRGVYPGVFDPVTLGHLDIACRAGRVVSRLIVAVAENPLKPTLFPAGQRLEMLREELSLLDLEADVEVCLFSGLLTEFCRESGTRVVIRGLRTSADFPYEFQHATARARLAERIESVFLMASEPHLCIFFQSDQGNRTSGRRNGVLCGTTCASSITKTLACSVRAVSYVCVPTSVS